MLLCWRCKELFCSSTTLTKWPDIHNEQCKNITGSIKKKYHFGKDIAIQLVKQNNSNLTGHSLVFFKYIYVNIKNSKPLSHLLIVDLRKTLCSLFLKIVFFCLFTFLDYCTVLLLPPLYTR